MTTECRNQKSTEFGLWLRKQKRLDSSLGYRATDIDWVFDNRNTGKWMILEEKRNMGEVPHAQKELLARLDQTIQDPNFCGVHVVIFEKNAPDEGRIWLDGQEVTEEQYLQFMEFKYKPEWPWSTTPNFFAPRAR